MGGPWRETDRYPSTVPIHALLSPDEIRYLSWLAAEGPEGALIDLGSQVGGSSFAMARASEHRGSPLFAYDAFLLDDPKVRDGAIPGKPGDSFLGIYRANLAPYMDRITIHGGYIAEFLAGAAAIEAVYPERVPVGVLFIDCAKRWGVHHSILHAFGPFLRQGSVVVQQDFRSTMLYLVLHMHQLRAHLRPAHSVDGGTVGFVARGPLPEADLNRLWSIDDIERLGFDAVVSEAAEAFDAEAPESLSSWVWLAAAGDRALRADGLHTIACLERAFERLPRLAASLPDDRWRVMGEIWTGECRRVASHLRDAEGAVDQVETIARLAAWGSAQLQARADAASPLIERWTKVEAECEHRGLRRIVLYGAGRHTQRLLAAGFPFDGSVEVVAIADDAAANWAGERLGGVPVVAPPEVAGPIDAVVPSSDTIEDRLLPGCRAIADRLGAAVLPVYAGG